MVVPSLTSTWKLFHPWNSIGPLFVSDPGRKKCIELAMASGADPTIKDLRGAMAYEYSDDDEIRILMGGKSDRWWNNYNFWSCHDIIYKL